MIMGRQNRKKRRQQHIPAVPNRSGQSQKHINPNDLAPLVCINCDNGTYFEPVFELRLLPAELSGRAVDQYLPLQRYRCCGCKTVFDFQKYMKTVAKVARQHLLGDDIEQSPDPE